MKMRWIAIFIFWMGVAVASGLSFDIMLSAPIAPMNDATADYLTLCAVQTDENKNFLWELFGSPTPTVTPQGMVVATRAMRPTEA
jgi:hypothetical protein